MEIKLAWVDSQFFYDIARLHRIWRGMCERCNTRTNSGYQWYGGRGIRVCPEWQRDFGAFCRWALSNEYAPHLSIDRQDNDGHYEPGNCRWATNAQQARNTSRNRMITAFGETKCCAEWSEDSRCTVTDGTIASRISRGVDPEDAISLPGVPEPSPPLTAEDLENPVLADEIEDYFSRMEGRFCDETN